MKALCLPPSQVMQLRAALLEQATADSEAPGGRGVAAIQTTEAVRAFPLFVLNLVAPPTLYDVTYEVSKTTIAFRDEEVRSAFVCCVVALPPTLTAPLTWQTAGSRGPRGRCAGTVSRGARRGEGRRTLRSRSSERRCA